MQISTRIFLLASIVSAALVAMLFLPGLGGGFMFDDKPNIIDNTAIHLNALAIGPLLDAAYSFQPGKGSRALSMLSFAMDYWRGDGLNPATFKVTNIVIHILTTISLAWFIRLLLSMAGIAQRHASVGAILAATCWAIHPLQVSSVLYVVQRMQTLGTLFLVLALFAYLHARKSQIEGRGSSKYWLLCALLWALAFSSKEDSILLPAYTLALELTVLRFRAARDGTARRLRITYSTLCIAGAFLFVFIAVPRWWEWGPYPGRNFSSYERLLTQARVLATYLYQILIPLPDNLRFFYDNIQPSRGLLNPPSTLFSIGLLIGLMGLAWHWRIRRPLFSLGIFWFLAGHFISSNILGLELAFEHRNHFPLIGIVIAVGDLLAAALAHLRIDRRAGIVLSALLVASLAVATYSRASLWGDYARFVTHSTKLAPDSPRAWVALCNFYFVLSKGNPGSEYLEKAISACNAGSHLTGSVMTAANLVIFKTVKGNATQADWDTYLSRLQHSTMSVENKNTVWQLMNNYNNDVALNDRNVINAISIVAARAGFNPTEYANIGYFILENTAHPALAYPYFSFAVQTSPNNDPFIAAMIQDLTEQGRKDWSARLQLKAAEAGPQKNL